MLQVFDPFIDYRCPHCGRSLRWKMVSKQADIEHKIHVTPYHCPHCHDIIVETRHPAIANNWLWSRFYLPGVILCALGIFIPALGWLLPMAVFVLFAGFAALIGYIIKARIGWKVYIPFSDDL